MGSDRERVAKQRSLIVAETRYLHLLRQDCPLPAGTHVVLYTRDSGGEEQDTSVEQQIDAAREYCQFHGLVLEHVYADEAKQASAIDKRDALAAMLHDLRERFPTVNDPSRRERKTKQRPFGVLCWKSNRLGRDLLHTRNVKTDLRLRALTIVSLTPVVETGNPAMDAMIEAFYEFNDEQLLKAISEDAKRGLARIVSLRDDDPEFLSYNPGWSSEGKYLSVMPGGVPTGFKAERIVVGKRRRKSGKASGELHEVQRIVPDPELWPRCRLAWDMRRQGATLREIMQATRLFTNVASFKGFFANRIYTGDLEYGGHVYRDFVEALIPRDWWEEEQRVRADRAQKLLGKAIDSALEPRRIASRHLLAGLVFCGDVDGEEHPMYGDTSLNKQSGSRYDFYICATKKRTRNLQCSSKNVGARSLEHAVVETLLQRVFTREHLRPLADAMAAMLGEQNHDAAIRLDAAQGELAKVERAITQLLDTIESHGASKSVSERLRQREGEQSRLQHEIATLERMIVRKQDIPVVSDEMLDTYIESVRAALQGDDIATARQLIQSVVAKIVIRAGQGEIYYLFPLASLGRRDLGNEAMDLRGKLPFPRLKVAFNLTPGKRTPYPAATLRQDVQRLQSEGMSFRQIAHALDVDVMTAWRAVRSENRSK